MSDGRLQPGWSRWVAGECDPRSMSESDFRFRWRLLDAMERAGGGPTPPEAESDFRCWFCRRVFRKEWTDAEAVAEAAALWPGDSLNVDRDFCTDCWLAARTLCETDSAEESG